MNKQEGKKILIRKKRGGGGHAHHGGAWKVAYADFVTAMMAFFLLMWLLSTTSKEQKEGLADFFNKIPIMQNTNSGTSVFNGDTVMAQSKLSRSGIGGSGKEASAGRDTDQRKDTATSEDVWTNGTPLTDKVAHDQNAMKTPGQTAPQGGQGVDAIQKQELEMAQREMERRIEAVAPELKENLNFKMTEEGLRIEITDRDNRPMFETGGTNPTDTMKKIMAVVTSVINDLTNSVSITGHTDSSGYTNDSRYSNWELSSDRATSARRLLMAYGFSGDRIAKVEGRADVQPLDGVSKNDARNRRIGIVLLKK